MASSPNFEELMSSARDALRAGDFAESLRLNEHALDRSRKGTIEEVRARRFIGLCHYRLNDLERSRDSLLRAMALADGLDDVYQRSLTRNHLGATLRHMGEPVEALRVLREGLQIAAGDRSGELRARLLANLGAQYDEAGQREIADEHYARYEELALLLDNPHIGANAHALAGRIYYLRNDLAEYEWRVTREAELAEKSGDAGRRLTAFHHQALLLELRMRVDRSCDRQRLLAEGHRLYDDAWKMSGDTEVKRRATLLVGRARLEESAGNVHAALHRLVEAAELHQRANGPVFNEPLASIYDDLARITNKLRLHGEALHYLMRAAESRRLPAEASEEWRKLYKPRIVALKVLAEKILEEARTVPRSNEERQQLRALLAQIEVEDVDARLDELADVRLGEQARQSAREFWTEVLGTDVFDHVAPDSQGDLVRSEIVYHGAVDDLGRSVQLIAVVFERELRERVLAPLARAWDGIARQERKQGLGRKLSSYLVNHERLGLGAILELLELIVHNPDDPVVTTICAVFGDDDIARLRDVLDIRESLRAVNGQIIEIRTIRNQVVHGRYAEGFPDRTRIDALRRELLMGPKSPLATLVKIRPPTNEQ